MKRVMYKLAIIIIVLAPFALIGAPNRSATTELQIRDLEEQRRKAVLHNNTQILDQLYAPNMVTIDIDGRLHTNTEHAAAKLNEKSTRRVMKWVSNEMLVNAYGNMAVVTQRADVADEIRGTRRNFSAWITDVWVKNRGRWQIVSRQGTRITPGK